jgi:tRNA-splicing endonuclease subunit Sen2
LKRELARRGSPEGKTVSEARTELRREERRLAKWERAKAELEALEKQRLAESVANAADSATTKHEEVLDEPVKTAETSALPGPVGPVAVESEKTQESEESEEDEEDEESEDNEESEESEEESTLETAPTVEASHPPKPAGRQTRQEVKPPVGPAELLALPNSLSKLNSLLDGPWLDQPHEKIHEAKAPVGPAELLLLPNSHVDLVSRPVSGLAIFEIGQTAPSQPTAHATDNVNDHAEDSEAEPTIDGDVNGQATKASASTGGKELDGVSGNGMFPNGTGKTPVTPLSLASDDPVLCSSAAELESDLKRRKSVRFSPTVESTTFLHSDPPSPGRSAGVQSTSAAPAPAPPNGGTVPEATSASPPEKVLIPAPDSAAEIENKEHFQLAPEEAFFLAFSLGALKVVDPVTGSPISTENLLSLFRSHSYFTPRAAPSGLRPDDPFLIHYAVYHHFRSLGWVPRHGIKFGVDWIIYQRGPVFDHSEFGIMVMPSFSDAAWEEHEHEEPRRSWSWLMGVNRVLSHVLKSLVLVYVDIPPPSVFDEEMNRGGIAAALKKYTIREVMVRRFSANRNR